MTTLSDKARALIEEPERWSCYWDEFDYVDEDWNIGGIGRARKEYAMARKTDEYGVSK